MEILFGDINPSGKLAETFPLKLEDNPSFLSYQGEKNVVEYREGIFVGYRYYDKKKMNVLFPFGHGLSYTSFQYSPLKISSDNISDGDTVSVSLDITNTGSVYGREAVQLYVCPPAGMAIRPVQELKGFEKVGLKPGGKQNCQFKLDKRSFSYFNMILNDWYVESGKYTILAGSSSRDIRSENFVNVKSTGVIPEIYDMNTLVGDLRLDPVKLDLIKDLLKSMEQLFGGMKKTVPVLQQMRQLQMK